MKQASASIRSGLSERASRLPLAGTRIGAERGAHAFRPRAPTIPANADVIDAIDREACRLATREIRCRIVQAHVVAELLKRRLWRPLGFMRLSDYAAERLGVRARSLEEDARVIAALESLHVIRMALETGAIRWTHARLLADIAAPETERHWLERALTSTTRQLAELVKAARASARAAGAGPGPDACASDDGGVGAGPDACAGDAESVIIRPDAFAPDGSAKTSPDACASGAGSGNVCPDACASSARPARTGTDSALAAFEALYGTSEGFAWVSAPPALRALDPDLENLLTGLDAADAHEVDRRLRMVRLASQRIDAELGACLRKVMDLGAHRLLGFADLRLYCESRLGLCGAKALALVRLDRQCALRSPALLRAYRDGRVTWLAATALLDVISRQHEDAWIERAARVTLRRLEADVSWALDRADDDGGRHPQPPPPLDLDVTADALSRVDDAEVQMRAHPQTDVASFGRRIDARIAAVMPASVATLLEDAIEGCRHAVEPRWRSFERILAHAWLAWTAQPHHDNPVFARDSYRCQVPGCRSRGPLHAHHVWFRSKGGPDFAWNLVSVCDAHHQAIHRGDVRVEGHAPDRLSWELGCRPGKAPLVRLHGDVIIDA